MAEWIEVPFEWRLFGSAVWIPNMTRESGMCGLGSMTVYCGWLDIVFVNIDVY